MIDHFRKETRHSGELYFDEEVFSSIKFNFSWNSLDPNNMLAIIDDAEENIFFSDRKKKASIKCKYSDQIEYQFELRWDLKSSRWGGLNSFVSVPISKYKEIEIIQGGEAIYINSYFDFPLINVTDNEFFMQEHPKYGAIFGEYKPNKDIDIKDFDFNFGDKKDFSIGSRVQYLNSKKTDNHNPFLPSRILASHSELAIKEIPIQSFKEGFLEKEVDKIFNILSFIEKNNINWFSSQKSYYDIEQKIVKIEKEYKFYSKPTKNIFFNNAHQYELRKVFKSIYEVLIDEDEVNSFNDVVYEFKIAQLGKTIEDSLVRWHSCLDFFKKRIGFGRNPFGKNLILALEKLGISIEDLIEKEEIQNVREGNKDEEGEWIKLSFNKFRDSYIHDGFDIFKGQYDEVIKSTRIMNAIAERMLLSQIGIDYRNTHLGLIVN